MVCTDALGQLGTKRRCGISLCVCILSDLIILAIYWPRIGDALKNPFIAIIESLEPTHNFTEEKNVSQDSNVSLPKINSSTTDYWNVQNKPGVARMLYHFVATLLYLGYTIVNIIILTNTIAKLYYKIEDLSIVSRKYKILRPFIFDAKSRLARWYFILVIFLHLLICMDDVLISHTVGFKLRLTSFAWKLSDKLPYFYTKQFLTSSTACFLYSFFLYQQL